MKQTVFVNYRLKYGRFESALQVGVSHKSMRNMFENQLRVSRCWNCALFGFYRWVVYFCTARLLDDRAHACDFYPRMYITNKEIMAGRKKTVEIDTKKDIKKGQATGKAPAQKASVDQCTQLYEVMQVRGVRGATLNTIDECIDYVAEYMNFCERNPFITYEIMKGGSLAGTKIEVEKKRAPSVGGFCLFIGWSIKDFNKNVGVLEKLAADGNADAENLYLGYCLIKELITTDMDESALAGIVDANYMAKLRGLRDLKDVTSNGKEAGTKAMQVNVLSPEAVDNLKKLGGI